jgi:nucleotide-binding universal stress UspA family protein
MKLLVTTDFSTNSKGAIRFAYSLAKQSKAVEVVFYHGVRFLKPTRWSDDFFAQYKKEETERLVKKLEQFVTTVIGKKRTNFAGIHYVIAPSSDTEKDIITYAEKNKIDYICIATRGAGVVRKIMGTHTSHIVNNAKTPVLVVPSHYRLKPLKKVTYLSDFDNLSKEIKKISLFLGTVKCNLEVLHYTSIGIDNKKFERNKMQFNKAALKNMKLNVIKNNLEFSLVERVSQYVSKTKPELLVMFTKKEKSFFESIFLPSKSAELTYTTKVPVLIYSK